MSDAMTSLLPPGRIAELYRVKIHQVRHVIDSRRVKAAMRVGPKLKLYARRQIRRIGELLVETGAITVEAFEHVHTDEPKA